MSKSKNDEAWESIFEKYHILDKLANNAYVSISSADINKFREARLMTKFDHRSQLPQKFTEHKLSILPTARGEYNIGTFETFHKFEEDDAEVITIPSPPPLESINYHEITSESIAINYAFVSGILQKFTGEELLFPTVCGRMSSSSFDFSINSNSSTIKINVENSQIEIDGGFEGESSLSLIEAKNYISDDFLIRQLYYPYRLWRDKISKHVRPIFLTYSNGVFHLREYEFTNPELYNSIRLRQHKKYVIEDIEINTETIQGILTKTQVVKEPKVPFPQADSFERIINLCELLKQRGFMSKEEITQNYDFAHRQTDYYSNAARYLGLICEGSKEHEIGYTLTQEGIRIFNSPLIGRQLEFVKLILSHAVFKSTLELYFRKYNIPTKDEVVEIMREHQLYKIASEKTYRRRASTVISWINWIVSLSTQS